MLEKKSATKSTRVDSKVTGMKNMGVFVQQNPSEEDLSHSASQPPAGAGFQSNSIIDGSQWLRPKHTLSPQPLSSAGASLPRDESGKWFPGSHGHKYITRDHT